jgi:hypothetical protein
VAIKAKDFSLCPLRANATSIHNRGPEETIHRRTVSIATTVEIVKQMRSLGEREFGESKVLRR